MAHLDTAPTAQAIVDRVKARVGVPWRDDTSDTWLAGHPATSVTGTVTTSMATLEVLRQAVHSGANLVITATPAFWSAQTTRRASHRPFWRASPAAARTPSRLPLPGSRRSRRCVSMTRTRSWWTRCAPRKPGPLSLRWQADRSRPPQNDPR